MTLIEELKQAMMSTKGKFAADDFYHIVDGYGMHRSAAAKAIRQLRDDAMIIVVGHRESDISHREMACYEVVPGAKFVDKIYKNYEPTKKKKATKLIKKDDCEKHHPNDHWWKKVETHPVMIAQNDIDSAMRGWL